jgi:hypothetical protein
VEPAGGTPAKMEFPPAARFWGWKPPKVAAYYMTAGRPVEAVPAV